jgi:hypothetical protein
VTGAEETTDGWTGATASDGSPWTTDHREQHGP